MPTVTSQDGTTIAYDRSGSGPVVFLVGGALQYKSDQLMGRLAPLLAKDFTVISYDRRGRGDSSDTQPYAIEREIEDMDAIIRAVGGSVCVFGMSSGGTLALLAATKLKSIAKLAVYEIPFVPEEQVGSAADYISELKKAVADGQHGKVVKLFMKRIGMQTPMIFMMSLMSMWPQLKALAPTLIYDGLIVGDGSVPNQLSSVTTPTLLITGTSDQMTHAAKAALAVLPNAHHQALDGQSHNVKPAVLAPALSTFFKQTK